MDVPLEGIKVIDYTLAESGHSCTKLLAEYGADVVWIEQMCGATTRNSLQADFYTAGKRGITLDLEAREGMEVMQRLLEKADVFVTNYPSKVINRFGLDYDTLHILNPRLIYAMITDCGDEDPMADSTNSDAITFWGNSGMLKDFAEKGNLLVPPVAFGDIATGQALAGGICAALYQREKTGRGEYVFTSLLAQAVYLNHDAVVESQYGEEYPKSRLAPRRALLNTYRCSDGKWITITITDRFDKYFGPLLKAIGREDLVNDPRWQRIEDTMYDKAPEVVAILDEGFAKMTQNEAVAALKKIDAPVSPVQSTVDILNDPQALANKYMVSSIDAGQSIIMYPANPVKYNNINSGISNLKPGPVLGQHSLEILRECRYSEEEIRILLNKNITVSNKKEEQ